MSLLNSDYKIVTGLEAARHNSVLDHTCSRYQFAVGKSKCIQHAIRLSRDAIFTVGKAKKGCDIADLDFEATFNNLCMEWVECVLKKKGLDEKAIVHVRHLYLESITIPVVNSIQGDPIKNTCLTLRQGDCPSSIWFSYGIDPLLIF